jgi:predicted alpha/beta hydrolase family esterase
MKPSNVLVLPGWHGSGAQHWQTLWEQRHGYRRVEQHDWLQPLRGDWVARLEDVLLSCDEPVVLVAHGLGCVLVAAWAAHSQNSHRVQAALLVAPADAEQRDLFARLRSFAPVALHKLPFPSVLVASRNDTLCAFSRARRFAFAWGSQLIDYGDAGHLNADAGLASWPEGHVLLQDLMKN